LPRDVITNVIKPKKEKTKGMPQRTENLNIILKLRYVAKYET